MTVHLTIDGQQVEVPEGATVLRAAQKAGVHIPTLCDHPQLVPSGGCRLCMVEVDGFRGPAASCTLPAGEGMVVHTDTERLRESRKFILTMLFSERNHFCPFCEVSGGDCELQNAAYGLGMTHWDYPPAWDKFPLDASHPNIVIDHNRCILCRRCVRACGEVVGNYTLGLAQRGARTMLVADSGLPLGISSCISCGMCVQVCPTGALIDRHSAYLGKTAQLDRTATVCLGCSVGCGVEVYTRDNQIVGIQGDWESTVNDGLTCRIGRFEPMKENRRRIQEPMIRKDGRLSVVSWEDAIAQVAALLKTNSAAAVASTRLTAEALAQFKQLFQATLGSTMATSVEDGLPTAYQAAYAQRAGQPFEAGLEALDDCDCVFVIGANPTDRHEVISFKIKRRQAEGLKVVVADTEPGALAALATSVIKVQPGEDAQVLRTLAAALQGQPDGLDSQTLKAASILKSSRAVTFLYGKGLTAQGDANALQALIDLVRLLREQSPSSAPRRVDMISVKGEANSLAASQLGLDQVLRIDGQPVVYLALGDDYPTRRLLDRLETARVKIVQAAYASAATEMADIILPVGNWAEQSGHYLNLDGRLQKAQQLVQAPKSAWSNQAVLQAISEKVGAPTADWLNMLQQRPAPIALKLEPEVTYS